MKVSPNPDGLQTYQLSEVANVKYGKAKPPELGSVPVIGSGGVYGHTSQPLADGNAIVIGRKGTAGSVYFPNCPSWPSDTTFYVEPNLEQILPEYLAFLLTSVKLSGEHAKTTMPSLQRGQLTDLLVQLPSLDDQRRIAHVLATIQRAITSTKSVITKSESLRLSATNRVFADAIAAVFNTAPPEVGDIPVVALAAVAKDEKRAVTSGPFGSNLGRKDYVNAGVPVIRGGNMTDNLFSLAECVYVSQEKADQLSGNLAYPGDLLVTQRGTLGQVALIPTAAPFDRFVMSQSQMKITVNETLLSPAYLYYWLSSPPMQARIKESAIRTGLPHINLAILRALPVPLLPLAVQERIVRLLQSIDRKILSEKTVGAALKQVFASALAAQVETL
jgi:type I restriction enzyme S subunit